MIEVEKKFQPTQEQLEKLLEEAEFLGEKINHDIYYDFDDLRLFHSNIKLRNRNGQFELKIGKQIGVNQEDVISYEIDDEEEIKKYLNIEIPLSVFVSDQMIVFSDYINNRKKYIKDGFTIDLDSMDFGYELCEVELLVENEIEAESAHKKIISFVNQFGIEIREIPSKRDTYLRLKRPELYKKIYEK